MEEWCLQLFLKRMGWSEKISKADFLLFCKRPVKKSSVNVSGYILFIKL